MYDIVINKKFLTLILGSFLWLSQFAQATEINMLSERQ